MEGSIRTPASTILALLLTLAAHAAGAAAPADFYSGMLSRGIAHFESGADEAATKELRIAAFGLMDSIEKFETAQAYLAASSARAGRDADARFALQRLLAAERIQARYGAVPLPAPVRAYVDSVAKRLLSADQLAALRRRPATAAPGTSSPVAAPQPTPASAISQRPKIVPEENPAVSPEPPIPATKPPVSSASADASAVPQCATEPPPAPMPRPAVAQTTKPPSPVNRPATVPTARPDPVTQPVPSPTYPVTTNTNTATPRDGRPAAGTAAPTSAPPASTRPVPTPQPVTRVEPVPRPTPQPVPAPVSRGPQPVTPAPVPRAPQPAAPQPARPQTPQPTAAVSTAPRQVPVDDRAAIERERARVAAERRFEEQAVRIESRSQPVTSAPAAAEDVNRKLIAANAALSAGNIVRARQAYSELAQLPLDRSIALRVAESLYNLGSYRDAVVAYQRAAPLRNGEETPRYHFAVSLYESGQYKAAKRELAAALPKLEATSELARNRAKIEGAIDR